MDIHSEEKQQSKAKRLPSISLLLKRATPGTSYIITATGVKVIIITVNVLLLQFIQIFIC